MTKIFQFVNESENRGLEVENFLLFVVKGFSLGERFLYGSNTFELLAEYTYAFVDEVHNGFIIGC